MKPLTVRDTKDAVFYLQDLMNYLEADDFTYFDPLKWEAPEEHDAIMNAYVRALDLIIKQTKGK